MKKAPWLLTLLVMLMTLLPVCSSSQNKSPLCFTARNGSVTVNFLIRNVTHTIQFSIDGSNWYDYSSGVTIVANQSVYFRAKENQSVANAFGNKSYYSGNSKFFFESSKGGTIEASGNIMSLYGPDCPNLPLREYAFASMFSGCHLLTTAPDLPATTLADFCYGKMFEGCTNLKIAPDLPATTLALGCYFEMFSTCYVLTEPPVISATVLADYCCRAMFSDCQELKIAPDLHATKLAANCYEGMFYQCHSLTKAPALPATVLAERCYYGMFNSCTSLTSIPKLSVTSLAQFCCYEMFAGCESLVVNSSAPGKEWSISAQTTADKALSYMFSGTGGEIDGTPFINTTYYVESDK